MKFIQRRKNQQGQSLVEFALTSLLFIFLLVSIIELGRILHAYLTIQYAARAAARYAVTGQRMAKYVTNPAAGWVAGSADIMKTIPPCWPRFSDDPASPTKSGPAFYEPYRNARTCSIEEQAFQAMRPLAVRPQAGMAGDSKCKTTDPVNQRENCPGFYDVVVSSRVDDWSPTTGTFQRGGFGGFPLQTVNYSNYYAAVDPDGGADLGAVNGFGGRPLDKVVVRIRFNHPVVTPLLSSIVPYIQLRAQVEVINESFGSTTLQRDPVLPPELPPIPPLNGINAPDLTINAMTLNGSSSPSMGDPVTFDLTVANQGLLNTASGYTVKLFVSPTQLPAEAPLPNTLEELGSASLSAIVAGTQENVSITGTFTSTGPQYVYAWIDADNAVTEDSGGNPDRETRNVMELAQVIDVQGGTVDLVVAKVVNQSAPRVGDTITYSITLNNPSTFTINGIEVVDDLPIQMQFVSATAGCSASGQRVTCLVNAAPSSLTTVGITVRITAGNPGDVITNAVQQVQLPSSYIDPDMTNNSASVQVVIDGVDLALVKTVADLNGGAALPGDTVEYTLQVTNISAGTAATSVTITDTLPPELTFVSADPPCTGTTSITCSIGTLNSGASSSVRIRATINAGISANVVNAASATSAETDVHTANNQDIAPLAVDSPPRADVAVRVTASVNGTPYSSGNLVKEGDIVSFKVTASNNAGPFDATGVVIDQISAPNGYLFFLSSAADSGSYDSGTGRWNISSLPQASSTTLTLRYRVGAGAAGRTLSLSSTITAVTQDNPDTGGNNSSALALPVSPAADLVVSQTASAATVEVGQTVTYTIRVGNGGPSTATDIVVLDQDLIDEVSRGAFTIFSATTTFGSLDASYRWTIPNLPYGSTATLEIVVQVNGLPATNPFANVAEILSLNEIDDDTSNNSASVTVQFTTP